MQGPDRRRRRRRLLAALTAAGAVAALAPAIASAARPAYGIWSGPGYGQGSLGFITNPSGTEVDNLAGTLSKPDPGDPGGWVPGSECGLPVGPMNDIPVLPDGSFVVHAPAIQGTVTIAGHFTSANTAVGTYRFSYDCEFAGPGPIDNIWHATVIDALGEGSPPSPEPAPSPPSPPSPEPRPRPEPPVVTLPRRDRARLCMRALPPRRVFRRGRGRARQACTGWRRIGRRAVRGLQEPSRHRGPVGRAADPIAACEPTQRAVRAQPGGFVEGYEGRGTWCRRLPLAVRLEFRSRRRDVPLGTLVVTERMTDRAGRSTRARPVRVRRLTYQLEWAPEARLVGARVRVLTRCLVDHGDRCGAADRTTPIGARRGVRRNVRLSPPRVRPGRRRHARTRSRLELTARGLPDLGPLHGALTSPRMRGGSHASAYTWVFPAYIPTLEVPEGPSGGMPQIVAHMKRAQASGKPGAPGAEPLVKVGRERQERNRQIACSERNRSAWPGGWPAGASCEEYPFASTRQGGHGAVIAPVPIEEQRVQGGVLNTWYDRFQVLEGDRLWVTAVP